MGDRSEDESIRTKKCRIVTQGFCSKRLRDMQDDLLTRKEDSFVGSEPKRPLLHHKYPWVRIAYLRGGPQLPKHDAHLVSVGVENDRL